MGLRQLQCLGFTVLNQDSAIFLKYWIVASLWLVSRVLKKWILTVFANFFTVFMKYFLEVLHYSH